MRNMKNIFELKEKVVVVTGGAGLLGKKMVELLALYGAKVYIAENDMEKGLAVCNELSSAGLDVHFVQIDISNEASILNCLKNILNESINIDSWINNAYPRTNDWSLDFEKIPFTSWRKNIDQHLNGYCFCCQQVGIQMKKHKKGSIINIASMYGIIGPDFSIYDGTDMTMPAAYSVIKGGIINFTRYLASYYGSYGIRVNSISPGGIFNEHSDRFVKNFSKGVPLGRMGTPEEIAYAVIYLSSDASSYITGHNLVVDGGRTII